MGAASPTFKVRSRWRTRCWRLSLAPSSPARGSAYDGVRPYAQFLMGIARNVVLEQSRTREVVAGLGPQDEGSSVDWELGAVGGGTESLEQQLEDQEMESLLASFKEGCRPRSASCSSCASPRAWPRRAPPSGWASRASRSGGERRV